MTLLYNLFMAAVDLAALGLLRRNRSLPGWGIATACAALAAAVAAVGPPVMLLGSQEGFFAAARLACYGLFVHGAVLLLGSAVLLRQTSRRFAVACAATAIGVGWAACDAFLVEPTRLEVSRLQIASPKIARPLRIVVLADLQTDHVGQYEREVCRLVMQEKPDLILLAGDYLQASRIECQSLGAELNAFLRESHFAAPGGTFAVGGNVDGPNWSELFAGLDVICVTSTRSFELEQLQLTCLSLADSYDPSLSIPRGNADRFHLVLGHSPNFALGSIEADLLVAGHTHGGQVRLPGLGPLVTHSSIPRRWAAGLTELPGGGKLLVSRGVGMERGYAPRLRFRCRPELVVIELVPQGMVR